MEETEGTESPTVESQYAYGRGIDDVLVLFDKDGESYDAYYYLKDPLWTVEALVDENAAIVEAYAYEVYGERGLLQGTVFPGYGAHVTPVWRTESEPNSRCSLAFL